MNTFLLLATGIVFTAFSAAQAATNPKDNFCAPKIGRIRPTHLNAATNITGDTLAMAFSRDSKTLAVTHSKGFFQKEVKLIDVKKSSKWKDAAVSKNLYKDDNRITFNSMRNLIATSSDEQGITFWNLVTGDPIPSMPALNCPQKSTPFRIRFFDNGKKIMGACNYDSIAAWDVDSGNLVLFEPAEVNFFESPSVAKNAPVVVYREERSPNPAQLPAAVVHPSDIKAISEKQLRELIAPQSEEFAQVENTAVSEDGKIIGVSWYTKQSEQRGVIDAYHDGTYSLETGHWTESYSRDINRLSKFLNLNNGHFLWLNEGGGWSYSSMTTFGDIYRSFKKRRSITTYSNAFGKTPRGGILLGRPDGNIEYIAEPHQDLEATLLLPTQWPCDREAGQDTFSTSSVAAVTISPNGKHIAAIKGVVDVDKKLVFIDLPIGL